MIRHGSDDDELIPVYLCYDFTGEESQICADDSWMEKILLHSAMNSKFLIENSRRGDSAQVKPFGSIREVG